MPHKFELNWTMTTAPDGDGTLVTRSYSPALPGKMKLMAPLMLPLVALAGRGPAKTFLGKMKTDLEARHAQGA